LAIQRDVGALDERVLEFPIAKSAQLDLAESSLEFSDSVLGGIDVRLQLRQVGKIHRIV
jgi:hypothetical protein